MPLHTSHHAASRLLLVITLLVASSVALFVALAEANRTEPECRGKAAKKNCPTLLPSEGATVSGVVTVTAETKSEVVAVQFAVDDSPLGAEVTTPPFEVLWDTTKHADGTRALSALVKTASGGSIKAENAVNVSNSTPPADTQAPSVSFTSPPSGATVAGQVTVASDATDNTGVVGVQFKLNGANLGSEDTSAPYSVAWDTTKAANGSHTLTAVARDAAGNTQSAQQAVIVSNSIADTQAPSVSFTSPPSGATVAGQVTVAADATDNTGVVGVQFKLNGANLGSEDTSAPYSVAWDTTKAANGSHTLTAVARDAAGNTQSAQQAVIVSNASSEPDTAPSLRWARPTLTNPITVTIPTRGQEEFRLNAGQDYRLRFENGLRYGPLRIYGGRNVVLIGGEQIIDDTVYDRFSDHLLLLFRDQTGTIHIEGYHGHGPGAVEGFNVWVPDAIFQLQNSRVEIRRLNPDGEPEHPDIFKTWSGPKEMRVWNFSGASDWQGFLFMRDKNGVYPGRVTMDRVNLWPQPNPAWGGKGWGTAHLWMLSSATQFRLGAVWVETGWWNGTYHKGLKDSLGYRDPSVTSPLWSWREYRADGTPYGPEYVNQPANTGSSYANRQGDWIEFVRPAEDNIWNLEATGRARIHQGRPSTGDFAPAAKVGRNYTP